MKRRERVGGNSVLTLMRLLISCFLRSRMNLAARSRHIPATSFLMFLWILPCESQVSRQQQNNSLTYKHSTICVVVCVYTMSVSFSK